MSQTVKCWCPERGESEEDAEAVEAYDARDAAERLIKQAWDPGDGTSFEVCTRDTFGVQRTFDVLVEAEPVFVATERRSRPGAADAQEGT